MENFKEETGFMKKIIIWVVSLMIVASVIVWFLNRGVAVIDSGIIHYEEFTEINQTCAKLNTDLCNMEKTPEGDAMFAQFTKAQRMLAIRTNLNRWVEDYNAKSKMWNRSLWKAKDLPYQLSTTNFNCY